MSLRRARPRTGPLRHVAGARAWLASQIYCSPLGHSAAGKVAATQARTAAAAGRRRELVRAQRPNNTPRPPRGA